MKRALLLVAAGAAAFFLGFSVCAMGMYFWILSHFRQADFDPTVEEVKAEHYNRYPRPLDNDWRV